MRVTVTLLTVANALGCLFVPFGTIYEWGLSSFFFLGWNFSTLFNDYFD